jgi:16S rRNA (cytidine1402-2'-O)-methyltransferase
MTAAVIMETCSGGIVTHEPEAGVLYLVGTPIGHRGDLSPRAQQVLAGVACIACEDTRHSAPLLQAFGIRTPLLSFHRHNSRERTPAMLQRLAAGEALALISDAGLPGISDPGEDLVAAVRAGGGRVVCVPGPCAAVTALVCSGLPCERFCFEGFLPSRGRERRQRLEALALEPRTTVLYEAPHRLRQLLSELHGTCGPERPLQVARELTKRHEQLVGPDVATALAHFSQHPPQGEFTLVLGGAPAAPPPAWDAVVLREQLQQLLEDGSPPAEACRTLARRTGHPRRALYDLLHTIGGAATTDPAEGTLEPTPPPA